MRCWCRSAPTMLTQRAHRGTTTNETGVLRARPRPSVRHGCQASLLALWHAWGSAAHLESEKWGRSPSRRSSGPVVSWSISKWPNACHSWLRCRAMLLLARCPYRLSRESPAISCGAMLFVCSMRLITVLPDRVGSWGPGGAARAVSTLDSAPVGSAGAVARCAQCEKGARLQLCLIAGRASAGRARACWALARSTPPRRCVTGLAQLQCSTVSPLSPRSASPRAAPPTIGASPIGIGLLPRSTALAMAAASAASATRPYQVVVWGASGFTGRLVCEHIAQTYQVGHQPAHLGLPRPLCRCRSMDGARCTLPTPPERGRRARSGGRWLAVTPRSWSR